MKWALLGLAGIFILLSGVALGVSVAPMQQVVADLKLDDMVAIAAYVASREP